MWTKFWFLSIVLVLCSKESVSKDIVSQHCLGCLCYMGSKCKIGVGCNSYTCGPFRISEHFWRDAGKKSIEGFPSTDNDYQNCAKDTKCAADTVQSYIEKFHKDCNGDGVINCEDFALLLLNGYSGCVNKNQTLNDDDFNECKKLYGGILEN